MGSSIWLLEAFVMWWARSTLQLYVFIFAEIEKRGWSQEILLNILDEGIEAAFIYHWIQWRNFRIHHVCHAVLVTWQTVLGFCGSPAGSDAKPGNTGGRCVWRGHDAGRPAPPVAAWVHPHCLWTEPAAAWRSDQKDRVVTTAAILRLKPGENTGTSRPDNHVALTYDERVLKWLQEEVKGIWLRFQQVHVDEN